MHGQGGITKQFGRGAVTSFRTHQRGPGQDPGLGAAMGRRGADFVVFGPLLFFFASG